MAEEGAVGATGNAGSDGEDFHENDPGMKGNKVDHQEVPGAKPPDKEGGEGQGKILEEGQMEGFMNVEERLVESKKPARNLLESIRNRNAKGLEQNMNLLGPGTTLYIKWPDNLKK